MKALVSETQSLMDFAPFRRYLRDPRPRGDKALSIAARRRSHSNRVGEERSPSPKAADGGDALCAEPESPVLIRRAQAAKGVNGQRGPVRKRRETLPTQ